MKYHHSIADGFSSIHLLLNLCTTKNENSNESFVKPRGRELQSRSVLESTIDLCVSTKNIIFPNHDTNTIFSTRNAEKEIGKASIYHNILNLDEVKKVAKLNNATVKDVIYSCYSGAIRKYILHHSSDEEIKRFEKEKVTMKAIMWVSLRKPSWFDRKPTEIEHLDLDIGCVMLTLPVKEENSKRRLRISHETLNDLLTSFEPLVSKVGWILIGLLPQRLILMITRMIGENSTFSYSNVPGPNYELEFCGASVDSISFFTFPKYSLGIFFNFISYNNQISASAIACESLNFKSEEYYKYFKQEFEELKQ